MTQFSPRKLLALLVALAVAGPVAAQDTSPDDEPVNPPKRRGFSLTGLGDFAATGLRSAGTSVWWTVNSGPGDTFGFYANDLPGRVIGTASSPNGYCCGFFELQLWMAASRSDWLRNRDIAPSLENAEGGGWNARMNFQRWAPDYMWDYQGKDGSLGTIFSGVTSEDGTGSCRDNSNRANGRWPSGLFLLPINDCPDTWVGGAFNGERLVPDSVWLNRFNADPNGFTWDDWDIPASERADKLYGSAQTFGVTVDYGREALQRMGSVVPGGTGKPLIQGYPLGIEWNFNAWTYAVPTVANAMFYKVTIVNKSAEVYGVGLDYDSLYLGVMSRPFHTTGTQRPALYAVPSKGAMYEAQGNINQQNCYGAVHGSNVTGGYTAGTDIRSCFSNTAGNRGFRGGAGGVIFLKSPIGDLRNKKFTDPSSPFYNPSHPLRGDTITFNHANGCGFSCAQDQFFGHLTRAAFGAYTNQEADALGGLGKTAGELTTLEYFDLFHTPDWPGRWSPSTPGFGGFAKYAPPNWDYNKDGINDTLAVLTCHTSGCQEPWTDTIPGGFPNAFHNAYHMGVGPIKLGAGDTTGFVIAFVSTPDSISFENHVDNVLTLYQNNWLSPEPPCPVRIASATTIGGNRQWDTQIRLFFDDAGNTCEDRFLIEQAKALRSSVVGSDIRLRVLNPRLINQIRSIAYPAGTVLVDTVPTSTAFNSQCGDGAYTAGDCIIVTDVAVGVHDSLFIFKSCDGGNTFTASTATSCPPDPARDVTGATPRYPWQAYSILTRDANGRYPRTFADGGVTGGLSYTYVVVGQAHPAVFNVIDSATTGGLIQRTYSVRPITLNGLSANTANPNVAVVYLPASRQGGVDTARVAFTVSAATDTIGHFQVFGRLARPVLGTNTLNGRLAISDSVEVVVYDADTTTVGITRTTVRLFGTRDKLDTTGTGTVVRRVATNVETYTSTDPDNAVVIDGRRLASAGYVVKDSLVTGTPQKWTFYRFRGTLPKVTFLQEGEPIYVTDSLNSTDLTPADAFERTDFNGLLVGFSNANQRSLRSTTWFVPGIGQLTTDASPTIGWTGSTARHDAAYSRYVVTFAGKEYGPGASFRIDRLNPAATQAAFTASLNSRAVAGNTLVSPEAAARIAAATGRTNLTQDSLAALTLPFTIRNVQRNQVVRVAVIKSERPNVSGPGDAPDMLLGSGGDTVRVTIPSNHWVPGDRLYLIEDVNRVETASSGSQTYTVVNGLTVDTTANGQIDTVWTPVMVSGDLVTWGPAVIGCSGGTCNPVQGVGGTGYTSTNPNQEMRILYYLPVDDIQHIEFQVEPDRPAPSNVAYRQGDLKAVRVVPNPYVMFSHYEQVDGTRRLLFTHLPPTGTIEIYTASGQFVQRLAWTEADLTKNCNATADGGECQATGDLFWNMRTKEDLLVGPGLFLFRVSTKLGGRTVDRIGKFVIIPSKDR